MAAALAYYTLFSLAPLLLIAITIAGFVFGREATEQQIVTTFGGLVGPQGAQPIQGLLHSASRPQSGVLGTLLGIGTLLIGAGGVISQLQVPSTSSGASRPNRAVACVADGLCHVEQDPDDERRLIPYD